MTTAALIVAAGRGTRATRGDTLPKQYVELGGVAVLGHTLDAFPAFVDVIQVVIHPDDEASYAAVVTWARTRPHDLVCAKLLPAVHGGPTRQASVLCGLEALAALGRGRIPDRVLVHDAARPFVSGEDIARVIAALDTSPGAILAVPLSDTLKRGDGDHLVRETIPRGGLWRAQTPQAFHFPAILAAHRQAAADGATDLTDDAAVAERSGLPVRLVTGSSDNIKLTTAEDLDMAAAALSPSAAAFEPRTGTGFDVHRFTSGDHVWLCGVRIPHTHTLEGHSDADVGLHALTDAILGAIGDGDIGQHFPPSDPEWKGAASHLFLADAARRVADRGGYVVNVDVTLLCEAPRIGPHRPHMQQTIARVLGIDPSRVGIKATTTEGLGFTGRKEGIAAMASAMVQLPKT